MREAERSDIPHGNEAQCPICWRIFSSDSACEQHKLYARKGERRATCVGDVEGEFGMEPVEKRGLIIWGPKGYQETYRKRREKMAQARRGSD